MAGMVLGSKSGVRQDCICRCSGMYLTIGQLVGILSDVSLIHRVEQLQPQDLIIQLISAFLSSLQIFMLKVEPIIFTVVSIP